MTQRLSNDRGNMLIICVVIIMILTSLGIYALNSTTVELTVAGVDKREKTNLMNAERGLKFAIAHFKLIFTNDDESGNILYNVDATGTGRGGTLAIVNTAGVDQLTITDVPTGLPTALRDMDPGCGLVLTYADNGVALAMIEVRDIVTNPTPVAGLSTFANAGLAKSHLSEAPEGYDSSKFNGRNYVITSTALDAAGAPTNAVVQCGIRIAQEQDQTVHLKDKYTISAPAPTP